MRQYVRHAFISCLLLLCCTGCLRRSTISEVEPATRVTITSSKTTNGGAPFYVVLKFTDFGQFLVDDYQTIANLSASENPDSCSIMRICMIPGKTESRIAKPPPGQLIGVYCLFTKCDERWKYFIDTQDCQDVTLGLGAHEISSVQMR
jgi:predicted component of type VI protein secretion system